MLENSVPEGLHPKVVIHAGAVCEERPWEVLRLENCVSSGRDPMWNKGKV